MKHLESLMFSQVSVNMHQIMMKTERSPTFHVLLIYVACTCTVPWTKYFCDLIMFTLGVAGKGLDRRFRGYSFETNLSAYGYIMHLQMCAFDVKHYFSVVRKRIKGDKLNISLAISTKNLPHIYSVICTNGHQIDIFSLFHI